MKKRRTINGRFAWQLIEMLESPAYRTLSLSALRVLARIQIEFARHGGKDNGKLPVTHEDFRQYGVRRHTIASAQRELEALGIIEITERGRAGNAEFRRPNLFRMTHRETENAEPTNEWRQFKTVEEAEATAMKARAAKTKTRPPFRGVSPPPISGGKKRRFSAPISGGKGAKFSAPISGGTSRYLAKSALRAVRGGDLGSPPDRAGKLPWSTPTVTEITRKADGGAA